MDSEYIYQKATALKVALPEGCETHLNYIAKTVTRMVDQTSDGEFTAEHVIDCMLPWMVAKPVNTWREKDFPRSVLIEYLNRQKEGTLEPAEAPAGPVGGGGQPSESTAKPDSEGEGGGAGSSTDDRLSDPPKGQDAEGKPQQNGMEKTIFIYCD